MAQYVLPLTTVADAYTEFPCPGTEYVNVQVFGAGVDIQYGRGFPAPVYGPFSEFLALTGFAGSRACDAIRFKNHVAGVPATIQITAQSKDNLPLGIPLGDSFSPNFLTISPSGVPSATFPGNVSVTEGETATSGVGGLQPSQIGWVSSLSGKVQAFLQAVHNSAPILFSGHNFSMEVLNDALTGFAEINLYADSQPSGQVQAAAGDGTNQGFVKIIDALQRSDFLQQPKGEMAFIGNPIGPYPATAPRTPNANRPTLVIACIFISVVAQTNIYLGANTGTWEPIISAYDSAPGSIQVTLPCTFICPAGHLYMLYAGGTSSASMQVYEYTL